MAYSIARGEDGGGLARDAPARSMCMEATRVSEVASGWIAASGLQIAGGCGLQVLRIPVSQWSRLASLCNLNYIKQKQTEVKEH